MSRRSQTEPRQKTPGLPPGIGLTVSARPSLVLLFFSLNHIFHETDLQTFQDPAGPQIWVPQAQFDPGGAENTGQSPGQRPETSHCLKSFWRRMNAPRTFTARQRIRKKADFALVRAGGLRIHCGAFILQAVRRPETGSSQARVGIITSRRVGSAVQRSRARRWIREVFRHNQELVPPWTDLVIVVRQSIFKETLQTLETRFRKACARLQCGLPSGAPAEGEGQ